jgi:ornithine cyclodeaminase
MVAPPFVSGRDLDEALGMADAIAALEKAFSGALPATPARAHHAARGGELLVMPVLGEVLSAVKLVTVAPDNPARGLPAVQGLCVCFDAETLAVRAVLDAAALTALRTAAVSGLATRHLAQPEAAHLVVFGAGVQARVHVEAMRAVRPIADVTIVSRSAARAQELARAVGARVGHPTDVAAADIVCTCTTSRSPVVPGRLLQPGCHVNAIGAYKPEARELDDDAVRGALVVVETREAALAEAGDVIAPLATGAIGPDSLVELAQVVKGEVGRASSDQRTVFKSVGQAFEDLAVAAAVLERLGL